MPKNFSEVLYQTYLEAPNQVALHLLYSRQPDQTVSYRELLHTSASYTHALAQANIQPGEVVILILQHGLELVASFFGVILQGAIPSIMPFLTEKLQPEQYRASLAALCEITTPAAIITYADFVEEVQTASVGTSVRAILVATQINHQVEQLSPAEILGLQASSGQIVLLQHSSGTTGLQKGVALSHAAVFQQLSSYSKALHLDANDIIVSWLPLYHDMGLIAGFLNPILNRIPLVLMSPFDWVRAPYRLMQAISHYRGTLCWLPNFAYNFCAQKIRPRDLENVNLSSLRAVINCSEPMHWKSHLMFLERFHPYGLQPEALATCYAMAENVFAVTQGGIDFPVTVETIDAHAFSTHQTAIPLIPPCTQETAFRSLASASSTPDHTIKMLSAGRPVDGVRLRILDPQGKELPDRQIGEIALQSNCMLTGYYHRPDLTQQAFWDGWYLTGDLGYLADGELYVTGRKKDLIIVGGKNIYPQDLERLAGEIPGIYPGRVVAFGVYDEQAGTEEVVLVAETDLTKENTNFEDESARLAAEIRQSVTRGSDIALRYVHIVERNWLIKTSSGKIARSANRTKYLEETHQEE